ncbi:MAG: hypothetical protein Q8Q07_06685 [Dehalococcoidales bacterium]|nr:hypothetical protein [Dehalococcoidales bacterium]
MELSRSAVTALVQERTRIPLLAPMVRQALCRAMKMRSRRRATTANRR